MRAGLSRLFFGAALAAAAVTTIPGIASAAPTHHRAVVTERATPATPAKAVDRDEAAAYAARERAADRKVGEFQGGSTTVVIGGSTLVIVLLVVLLVVLL